MPRDIWVIAAATMINRVGMMVFPFMALYLRKRFEFTEPEAASALVLFGIGSIMSAPVFGRLSDSLGALRLMRLSLLLSGAILAIFPLVHTPQVTLAVILLWAFVSEGFRPASLTVVNSLVTPEQRDAGRTLCRLAANLGMAIGPALGGLFVFASVPLDGRSGDTSVSYVWLFLADGATSLAAFMVLALSLSAESRKSLERRMKVGLRLRGMFRLHRIFDLRFLLFLMVLLPALLVFFQEVSTLPLFMTQELRLTEAHYGSLFFLNGAMVILLEVHLVKITGDWSHGRALATGAMLLAVGYGALVFANSYWYVLVTAVVWTFGEMLLINRAFAYATEVAPKHRHGQYMGDVTLAFSLAIALGPWLGTAVAEGYGRQSLWAVAFLCAGMSALGLLLVPKLSQEGLLELEAGQSPAAPRT